MTLLRPGRRQDFSLHMESWRGFWSGGWVYWSEKCSYESRYRYSFCKRTFKADFYCISLELILHFHFTPFLINFEAIWDTNEVILRFRPNDLLLLPLSSLSAEPQRLQISKHLHWLSSLNLKVSKYSKGRELAFLIWKSWNILLRSNLRFSLRL